jgi:hypothetical protein
MAGAVLIPELQRRSVFHKAYAGRTLRQNLGLPMRAEPVRRGCEHGGGIGRDRAL